MTRAVLLRHDLPDGSHHYDWMIELDRPADEHRLLTLRVAPSPTPGAPAPLLDPAGPSFEADLLPLHRAAYLTYQGPLSGDRGRVTRVGSGPGAVLERTDDALRLTVDLGPGTRTYTCSRIGSSDRFACTPGP